VLYLLCRHPHANFITDRCLVGQTDTLTSEQVKVKFTPEQATKAQTGIRDIAVLFL
jgi:hypothetical protein